MFKDLKIYIFKFINIFQIQHFIIFLSLFPPFLSLASPGNLHSLALPDSALATPVVST